MLKIVCLTLAMFAISLQAMAADMEYTVIEEPKLTKSVVQQAENLIDWTPLAFKALWQFAEQDGWTWSLEVSKRLDLLCDIREEWRDREKVFTFWLGVCPR